MQVLELGMCGVKLLSPQRYQDERGWFEESFNRTRFAEAGLPSDFVQDNQSFSRRGVLRGLHYQLRQPQGKLIRVLSGHIWDVAVDLRRSSPSFGQWTGVELRSRNADGNLEILWIPEGFAHGFLVLSEGADVLYKVTRPYDRGGEHTLAWNDRDLDISWPLDQLGGMDPIVSSKDAAGLRLIESPTFPPT